MTADCWTRLAWVLFTLMNTPTLITIAFSSTTAATTTTNNNTAATASPPTEQGKQPADYCVPEAWQGGRAVTHGVLSAAGTSVKRVFTNIVYSARQKKMVLEENVYGRGGQYRRHIFDYPQKVLYTITESDPQTCTKTALPGPFTPQCVPGDSDVSFTNSTYGVGVNFVAARELSGIQRGVHYRVSLTYDTNVPIFEELWGSQQGDDFYTSLSFYNVSIVRGDFPSDEFKPPSICLHSTQMMTSRSVETEVTSPLWMMP